MDRGEGGLGNLDLNRETETEGVLDTTEGEQAPEAVMVKPLSSFEVGEQRWNDRKAKMAAWWKGTKVAKALAVTGQAVDTIASGIGGLDVLAEELATGANDKANEMLAASRAKIAEIGQAVKDKKNASVTWCKDRYIDVLTMYKDFQLGWTEREVKGMMKKMERYQTFLKQRADLEGKYSDGSEVLADIWAENASKQGEFLAQFQVLMNGEGVEKASA